MAYHRESLARRTAEDAIHGTVADPSGSSDIGGSHPFDGVGQDRRIREIEFVSGAVDGIDLGRSDDVEARLFKSETQSACSGKKIDRYRSHLLTFSVNP
jgi:hypothetical protein